MAKETQIGELVISLKTRLDGLEKGLETAKKKLQEIEEENKNLKNSNSEVDASFIAMSASIIISIKKVKSIISECVDVYKDYTNANVGLKSILDGQGKSFSEAQEFIEEYISDGLIPLNNAVTAYKNLALRGYNTEQIKETMINLKNAAAFGRQSTLEYGYAIQSATEGLKNFNPVLVDNAGVTKNMSVMYDEFASKIGTTAAKLTDEQKILAEVNGIAEETKYQMGDAAKYAETYSGQQAQLNAKLLETKEVYAESLEPILSKIVEIKTKLIQILEKIISNNSEATAGTTAFVVTLLTLGVALTAGMKLLQMYKKSIDDLNISGKALKTTLAGIGTVAGIIGIVSAITVAVQKNQEATAEQEAAQEKLNEAIKVYNDLVQEKIGYTDEEIERVKKSKETIEEKTKAITNEIEELKEEIKISQELYFKSGSSHYLDILKEQNEALKELEKTYQTLNPLIDKHNQYLDDANTVKNIEKALDITTAKSEQQKAAALKNNVKQMQDYLNVAKTADKSTTAYQEAVSALAKAYPEAVSNGILLENQVQKLIDADSLKADTAWQSSQETIKSYIDTLNAALQSEAVQKQVAQSVGDDWENIAPRLQSVLSILQTMAGYTPTEVPIITTSTPKTHSSSSYSNKALDNYKKQIEHKKALDQITLKEEIAMYETALKKYAKTADEKNEIREKIYELNKELAKKEKDILDQQTKDYENYIQEQKNLRGAAYDITEQTADYNKIIQMHKNYLNQVMKDERLSLEERKEIYREELDIIRDYEQQKRDIRVEQIDNTVTQLTNAITKQLEEMQKKDKELIDKNLEEVEKWKDARIKAINEEYDTRIEAIEKELDLLNKAEQQKTRDEEDAEYERKKIRLEQLVAFEHDATTKANYQKELDKLIAEYQKTLDKRELEDKKEALNAQKELLKEEQNNQKQAIEDEADKQKELYEKQLDELENYYNEQIDMAQETAEKMLLNVEQNQDQILNLLKSYGNAYEITGQSLGEKLAQGINEGLTNKIENIIQRLQDAIDIGIENTIANLSSSVYRYEAGANKPQTATVVINQTNNIEQNPEMPSETFRKLNNVSQKLAEEFAGM